MSETKTRALNLAGIADLVAERVDAFSAQDVTTLVDRLSTQIAEGLSQGREVVVESFAKMRPREGAAGEPLNLPDYDVLAEATGKDTASVEAATQAYFDVVSERLAANDKLKIERFLALKVAEEKPRIVDEPISGRKTIAPSRKVISFMTHPEFRTAIGGREIEFIPAPGLKDGVESVKTATILLAIAKKDEFADTVQYHFERAGWQVRVSQSVDDAVTAIEEDTTYLVLIDASLPGYLDLCERIKTQPKSSLIPVILMLPSGSDPQRASEFRVMGNEHVAQPFEIKELLTMAETELARSAEEQVIFAQQVQYEFPTTDDCIDKANEMAAKLFQNSGLDEEGQVAMCAAFREGCGNAAQHGNKHRRDKNVDVLYLLDGKRVTVVITDEGKGFEWTLYVDDAEGRTAVEKARKRHQQGKLGGLGIMLMTKCTDRIEYNAKGNIVTLTKMLEPSS